MASVASTELAEAGDVERWVGRVSELDASDMPDVDVDRCIEGRSAVTNVVSVAPVVVNVVSTIVRVKQIVVKLDGKDNTDVVRSEEELERSVGTTVSVDGTSDVTMVVEGSPGITMKIDGSPG